MIINSCDFFFFSSHGLVVSWKFPGNKCSVLQYREKAWMITFSVFFFFSVCVLLWISRSFDGRAWPCLVWRTCWRMTMSSGVDQGLFLSILSPMWPISLSYVANGVSKRFWPIPSTWAIALCWQCLLCRSAIVFVSQSLDSNAVLPHCLLMNTLWTRDRSAHEVMWRILFRKRWPPQVSIIQDKPSFHIRVMTSTP